MESLQPVNPAAYRSEESDEQVVMMYVISIGVKVGGSGAEAPIIFSAP